VVTVTVTGVFQFASVKVNGPAGVTWMLVVVVLLGTSVTVLVLPVSGLRPRAMV
jgi:hypothetical protein